MGGTIGHFTIVATSPGLRLEVRLPVTLFWYKPLCVSNVNVDYSEFQQHNLQIDKSSEVCENTDITKPQKSEAVKQRNSVMKH